ncbi:MAG: hypothetical protein SFX73_14055 [Kofleriaceae bacterium]|nr:hypothetical protein [Kofleriaceae bacterium]
MNETLIGTGLAARLLGLSQQRVRQLDDHLRPVIGPTGRRRYDRATVERFAARRDAERSPR